MTSAARKLEAEFNVEERIQSDIAELKADYRALYAKVDGTRDDISRVRESISQVRESVATLRAEMKEGFANMERRMTEFATKADLTAKADELHRRIDETKASLMEHMDIVFDRKFFRATGIMVGAVAAIYGGGSYLDDQGFTGSEKAAVGLGVAVAVWLYSLFAAGRQRRA